MSVRPTLSIATPHVGNAPPAAGQPGLDFPWPLVLDNTIVGISYMKRRRFVWANARMAEIFGYAPGELDGSPVRRLYATQEDYEDVGRLMATASPDAFVTHERGMACKDGRLIWCRISGRVLQLGASDSPSVWVVQDLSDKKRAEDELRRMNQRLEQIVERRTLNLRRTNEALRSQVERSRELQSAVLASRDKFRTLFRHMPLGVLVVDANGALSEFNRTLQTYLGETTRARMAEIVETEGRVLLADGTTTSLAALLRQRASAPPQRVDRFEFGWLATSGRRREIAAIAAPLTTGTGGVVFTFSDVTEAHRLREQEHEQQATLAHAARLSLMGQMASTLAHELGQPLNAAQSYITGLRLRFDDVLQERPEAQSALEKATRHLEQAAEIIRNVRSFVAREPVEFERVDLPQLVAQTVDLLEIQLRGRQTPVDVVPDPADATSLPAARCHRVEIQQVLVNLVMNGLEAMDAVDPAERRITIRIALYHRGQLCVEVADRGPGVDPDFAPRIFQPYATSKANGLGMGLMIARTIVESHGGSLRQVRYRPPGATFRFTLPVWSEA
jgi:PAS domain S-box-containing protein